MILFRKKSESGSGSTTPANASPRTPLYFHPIFIFAIAVYLPLCVLLRWLNPWYSNLTIGRDYVYFGITQQMEYLFALRTGTFPLFIPGFGGGQSSAAMTLGGLFHPLTYIEALVPAYWHGSALNVTTVVRLISLGFTQMAVYGFFRRLGFDRPKAFLLSFIAVYNLRMVDNFRWSASLETWTGINLACAAIGYYCATPKSRLAPFMVILGVFWIIVSGHPTFMYWGVWGTAAFTLLIPFFVSEIGPVKLTRKDILVFWLKTFCLAAAGIALAAMYVLPFVLEFVRNNGNRVGNDFQWALAWMDNRQGIWMNFVEPMRSDIQNAFGGSSLYLLAALAPLVFVFGFKRPSLHVIAAWLWGFLIIQMMEGDRTPVYYWIWRHVPFANDFRCPGRTSEMLPIILTLLIAWLISEDDPNAKNKTRPPRYGVAALCLYAAHLPLEYVFRIHGLPHPTFGAPAKLLDLSEWIEFRVLKLGALSLVILAVDQYWPKTRKFTGILLCVVVIAQLKIVTSNGIWKSGSPNQPTFDDMMNYKRLTLNFPSYEGAGMETRLFMKAEGEAIGTSGLAAIFHRAIVTGKSDAGPRLHSHGRAGQDEVVISRKDAASTKIEYPEPSGEQMDTLEVSYASYNRLVFDTETFSPGFVRLNYLFDKHWRAWVNGRRVPVERSDGFFNVIEIPAGKNVVDFRYWSWPYFFGWLITCATLSGMGIAAGRIYARPERRRQWMILGGSVGAAVFIVWRASLYSGSNYHVHGHWNSERGWVGPQIGRPRPPDWSYAH
ncbi:MAG: hypothetical protein JO102_03995 [Elusimicrobia bacterium]|nr:hypothetical protein [Elusimicrobiota bacterium]